MSDLQPETKVQKAANNAVLTLIARGVLIAAVPLGGVAANEVWSSNKQTSAAVIRLDESVKGLTSILNSRIDAHADRLKGIDERNNDQDRRINEVQRDVYTRLPRSANP